MRGLINNKGNQRFPSIRILPNSNKGNILTENIIFIVLNLIFFAILIIFLFSKTGSGAVLEEKYAKQIALIIDSAEPEMIINLNMEDAIKIAQKENRNLNNVVSIQDNVVKVQLGEKEGYGYSFFSNIDVSVYPNTASEPVKEYVIFIGDYK